MDKIYNCNLCMHKEVCDLWSKHECQDASSFQLDGCDYYRDKNRYICVDDINGPGPDPRGEKGNPGYIALNDRVSYLRDYINAIWTYICTKEEAQCGDASGHGND